MFIRHVTLTARRSGYNVTRSVINATIIEANDGDEDSATLAKCLKEKNTVYITFSRPSNKYPFVSNPFGTKVIRNGITGSVLSELVQHLNWVEVYVKSVNMSTTLIESDSPISYLDKTCDEISNVFPIVQTSTLNLKQKVMFVMCFVTFCAKRRYPLLYLISCIKLENTVALSNTKTLMLLSFLVFS